MPSSTPHINVTIHYPNRDETVNLYVQSGIYTVVSTLFEFMNTEWSSSFPADFVAGLLVTDFNNAIPENRNPVSVSPFTLHSTYSPIHVYPHLGTVEWDNTVYSVLDMNEWLIKNIYPSTELAGV